MLAEILRVLPFFVIVVSQGANGLSPCRTNEYRYAYTECDGSGGRWRVALPLAENCELPVPTKGKPCTFSCAPGMFMDVDGDQECHPCPAGTFSLGGSVLYEHWDSIPAGFDASSGENILGSLGVRYNCSRAHWEPKGDRLLAVSGPCTITLSYSVKLVTDGAVSFVYQAADSASLFQFKVRYDCGSGSSSGSHWLAKTEENAWATYATKLSAGVGIVLSWSASSFSDVIWDDTLKPTMLKSISISGTSFTSQCVACRNGTYSSGGAQFCTPCSKDTYSGQGATTCVNCAKEVEHAPEGSSKCFVKPPCSREHYFEYMTPCQGNLTTRMYRWLEPLPCNPMLNGSVTLPSSGLPQPCPPCNPGMSSNGTACITCPRGTYSDGTRPCARCPLHTAPVSGVDYKWWNSMPPNVSANCITTSGALCDKDVAWSLMGDHIATSAAFGDNYAVLWLNVAGFRGREHVEDGKVREVARITFVFEMDCSDKAGSMTPCSLMFLKQQEGEELMQIEKWQGRKVKQPYSFSVTRTDAVTFMWVFSKTGSADLTSSGAPASPQSASSATSATNDNVAKIYSINITNTLDGGASRCEECPLEVDSMSENGPSRCTLCPDGHFMERGMGNSSTAGPAEGSTCQPCPPGTIVRSGTPSFGSESCRPCGSGLVPAMAAAKCRSDCTYTSPDGKQFDFSAIAGPQALTGNQLFAGDGSKYYHKYMVNLCPQSDSDLVECVNNITASSRLSSVKAMACRSTIVPSAGDGTPALSTQPMSIADEIISVTADDSVARRKLVAEAGYSIQDLDVLVHFKYVSAWPTHACPDGRSTIITLLCDPAQTGRGVWELPPKCPDGTCDGCSFMLLWRTRHGCPRCSESAYSLIVGECIGGEQAVHLIPPKHCVIMDGSENTSRTRQCSTLSMALRITIVAITVSALILIICVVYCWCRNRKLTYKYMALVETASSRGRGGSSSGELPAADSCALGEDEEEDVAVGERKGLVVFSKSRLLSKLKGSSFSQENDGFEKMHLVGGSFTQSQI